MGGGRGGRAGRQEWRAGRQTAKLTPAPPTVTVLHLKNHYDEG